MTTDTDTQHDVTGERAIRPDYAPSSAYDGLYTPDEINARYKELFAKQQVEYGRYGVPQPIVMALGEDMRRAFARVAFGTRTSTDRAPRSTFHPPVANPIGNPDGTYSITCVGPCGETLPEKKFPTIKPGVRVAECRDCRNARLDDSKGNGKVTP